MADNHPMPADNGHDQQVIARIDHQAHDEVEITELLSSLSHFEHKIADQFDLLDEHESAERVRHDQIAHLREAATESQHVVELLIQELILKRMHSQPEIILQLHTRFPQLRGPLAALYEAVRANTPETDILRRDVERTYRQLSERLTRPVQDQATAVAFLELLESYLKQIEQIARVNKTVRTIWTEQSDTIAAAI